MDGARQEWEKNLIRDEGKVITNYESYKYKWDLNGYRVWGKKCQICGRFFVKYGFTLPKMLCVETNVGKFINKRDWFNGGKQTNK